MCYTARTLTAFPLSSGVHGPVWWHSGQRVRGAFGTVLRLALMSTSPFRVPACVQSHGCVAGGHPHDAVSLIRSARDPCHVPTAEWGQSP